MMMVKTLMTRMTVVVMTGDPDDNLDGDDNDDYDGDDDSDDDDDN